MVTACGIFAQTKIRSSDASTVQTQLVPFSAVIELGSDIRIKKTVQLSLSTVEETDAFNVCLHLGSLINC